jgi:predicted RNA-binding protein YlqC (UPF0109 family)
MKQKIANALLGVIRLMVDEPEAMTMIISDGPLDETAIHVSVSAADAGKLIGKEGRTASVCASSFWLWQKRPRAGSPCISIRMGNNLSRTAGLLQRTPEKP